MDVGSFSGDSSALVVGNIALCYRILVRIFSPATAGLATGRVCSSVVGFSLRRTRSDVRSTRHFAGVAVPYHIVLEAITLFFEK
jgi:hypothetical protein